MDNIFIWLFLSWVGVALMMTALWVFQVIHEDAGIVDAGWALGIGMAALFLASRMETESLRPWVISGATVIWSLRLGSFIFFKRVLGKTEDARYRDLRRAWALRANVNFFLFFQMQGILVIVLVIPVLAILLCPRDEIGYWDIAGCVLILLSIVGETVADRQLSRWRESTGSKSRVCRDGLWRYSRHPNYFFEWLHWMGYPIMGLSLLGTRLGWVWPVTWIGPAVVLFFILKVTGIPPTEEQALKSRGDEYRRYQRETSAFFPWFPRSERKP